MSLETYLESLRNGLRGAMETSSNVVVLGEDILDPYGGAFKVTKGLSSEYPDRVLATPISESGIVGVATGMAIRGFRPVAEIMFGDFITLCADQLINSATKFPLMYRDSVTVPMVIRTPMGGGRGYGPTHSQSLEKLYFGVPGLNVIAPSLAHNPGELLKYTILQETTPSLFVEYKTLYSKSLISAGDGFQVRYLSSDSYPVAVVENYEGDLEPDVVLISYGGASEAALSVMKKMISEEIRIRTVLPSLLNGVQDAPPWSTFIKGSELVIVAEQGTSGFDWGAEICSQIYTELHGRLQKAILRMASSRDVIPAARNLEVEMLFGESALMNVILTRL